MAIGQQQHEPRSQHTAMRRARVRANSSDLSLHLFWLTADVGSVTYDS